MKTTKGEFLTCYSCGKQDETVQTRACVYAREIGGDPEYMETICDDCETQHAKDI